MAPTAEAMVCRSALNRVRGMPFRWSLNPYRGCAHACVYCYARRTHTYLDLGAGSDFSSRLFAKLNVAEVLEAEVSSPGWAREEVAVGTATDPYQPLEGRLRLTRACLEVLARHRTPATVVTKGPMVRRDTDLLQELSRRAGCTVCVSIPTVDEAAWRATEPGTAAPRHRLLAVRHLAAAGVRVGVLLAPLLPGITDGPEQVAAAVRAAAAHGACFVEGGLAYLTPDVKAYFYGFLRDRRPELLPRYERLYPGAHAPATVAQQARERVACAARASGVADRRPAPLLPPPRPTARAIPGLEEACAIDAARRRMPY